MFKDLLVPMTSTDGDDDALAAAMGLAEGHRARLAVLIAVELFLPLVADGAMVPVDLYRKAHEEELARGRERAQVLRERLAKAGVDAEVRVVETRATSGPATGALHARHADLAVLPASAGNQSQYAVDRMFVEVLMSSGRPVLLIPPGYPTRKNYERVLVAWQPTREASRAVHDALPFLLAATNVDVLVVDSEKAGAPAPDEPGEIMLAAHLARHGVTIRVVRLPRASQPVAAVILEHAVQTGAQLIVAGGYGHSRVREQVLGGVTQDLLRTSHLPVLFSH